MGGGRGEFSSRRKFFSLSNSLHEYFLGLIGVHEFFSFNFPNWKSTVYSDCFFFFYKTAYKCKYVGHKNAGIPLMDLPQKLQM